MRAIVLVLVTAVAGAQPVDPLTYPLADLSAVQAVGSWTYDASDGAGGDLTYGGGALGVSEDGTSLYTACVYDQRIAKIEIPALGGRGRVLAPCRGPDAAEIAKIHPDPNAGTKRLGGVLEQDGRMVVTAYISYDAAGRTIASHWSGPSLTQLVGPFAGTVQPGMVKSQMGPIPLEWRAALGGPAFSTAGYTSIISRASYGAAFSVFDPARVTGNGFPMQLLLGCPDHIAACRTWTSWGPSTNGFEGAELSGGAFIVPGTRTLVVIERESSGTIPVGGTVPMEGYGLGTTDPTKHGTPDPVTGKRLLYSPTDPLHQQQNKGYPYRLVAKLYDLADIVEVKQGRKQPWDVKQYATVDLPGSGPGEFVTSGAYNPVRNEYYLLRMVRDAPVRVDVYRGFGAPPPPPPPPPPPTEVCGDGIDNDGDGLIDENCAVDCVESPGPWGPGPDPAGWSPWTVQGLVETRYRARAWTQTTAAAYGGQACTWTAAGSPATERQTDSRPYTPPPPPAFIGRVRSQATFSAAGVVAGIRVTLQVPASMLATVPTRRGAVTLSLPLLDGTIDRRTGTVYRVTPNYGYAGAPTDAQVIVEFRGMSAIALRLEAGQ